MSKIKNFFLNLQTKDEATKKNWLILLSAASMIVVITLWGFYVNYSIQDLREVRENNNPGFFQTFKNGLGVTAKELISQTGQLINTLESLAKKTNSITIEPSDLKNTQNPKP